MSTSTAKLSKGGTAVVIDPAHDLLRVEGHPLDSIFFPQERGRYQSHRSSTKSSLSAACIWVTFSP